MEIRKILPSEYPEALRMYSVCFEYDEGVGDKSKDSEFIKKVAKEPRNRTDANQDAIWAAFNEKGEMMSNMASIPFVANFDSHQVKMSGIGGVVTLPVHRQCGAVRKIFEKILLDMKENSQVLSYLYPFSYYFYRKFGYERCGSTVEWKIKLTAMPKSEKIGHFEMFEPNSDISPLEKVYNEFSSEMNIMTVRDEWSWKKINVFANPYEVPTFTFIYYDENNIPQGYFQFVRNINGSVRSIDVPEFCFNTNFAAKQMLAFLGKYQSDYSFAKITMPIHLDLSCFVSEYATTVERTLKHTGMMRVVDVEQILKIAKYKGEGSFTVEVVDESASWNTGVYKVEFSKGETKVERTTLPADIQTDIQAFSMLIVGECDLIGAKNIDTVKINSNIENLEKAFYKKPLWINDYF